MYTRKTATGLGRDRVLYTRIIAIYSGKRDVLSCVGVTLRKNDGLGVSEGNKGLRAVVVDPVTQHHSRLFPSKNMAAPCEG
jgi:hypothetical protein